MKKALLIILLVATTTTTFAETTSRPKNPKYKLGRRLNRAAIVVVGTAFLINIVRAVKMSK